MAETPCCTKAATRRHGQADNWQTWQTLSRTKNDNKAGLEIARSENQIKWPHFYLVDETSEPSTTCGTCAWMLKDRMSRSMPRSSWWVDSRNGGIWTDLRTSCTWSKSFQNPFKPALYTRTILMKRLAFCGNDELSVIVAKAWGWSTPSWEPRPCMLAHVYHPGKSSSACCKVCCACHPCEIVKGAPTDVWSVNVCTRIVSQSVKEALHALYQIDYKFFC